MFGFRRSPGDRARSSRRTEIVSSSQSSDSSFDTRCEPLEQRRLLSFPPLPVVPGPGETQILQNALRFAQAQPQQLNPWDNQPMPFAVVGTNLTSGQVQVVRNNPTAEGQTYNIDEWGLAA